MGKGNQLNTLLVEIMIAVLFFALSSTVILETFVVTRNQSRLADVYNVALMEAQNIADKLYASGEVEQTLEQAGFTQEGDVWTYTEEVYNLRVVVSEEETEAGVLLSAEVSAVHKDEAIVTLPCSRYIPREVRP